MKYFAMWILLIIAIALIASGGGCALETVAANNKDKIVTLNSETWGGRMVAELTSSTAILPNLTLCFGKTNAYYNATPAATNPELVKALSEHIKASNSTVSATAQGFASKKE